MRGVIAAGVCVVALALAPGASARVLRAESILPPGQSGFVSIPEWRIPRPMFDFQGLAGASPPPLPFFERGTWEQLVEVGPWVRLRPAAA